MKHACIISLLLAVAIFTCHAQDNKITLSQQADSAYNGDNFNRAAELYHQIIKEEGPSASLFYNLGNCYYRLKQPGRAILYYEKALKLSPADNDIRANLDFVNSKIVDRPDERGTFIGNALDSAASSAQSNTWAWIAFSLFALTVAAAALYIFSGNITLRKIGFFGGAISLILTVVGIAFSIMGAKTATTHDEAIITEKSTILSTSPREPRNRHEEAMLLHEGTKIRILDSVQSMTDSVKTTWYDAEIDNNHRAWINSHAVEII